MCINCWDKSLGVHLTKVSHWHHDVSSCHIASFEKHRFELGVESCVEEVNVQQSEQNFNNLSIIESCVCTESSCLVGCEAKSSVKLSTVLDCCLVLKLMSVNNCWQFKSHDSHVLLKSNLSERWHYSKLEVSAIKLSLESLVESCIKPQVEEVSLLAVTLAWRKTGAEAKVVTYDNPVTLLCCDCISERNILIFSLHHID